MATRIAPPVRVVAPLSQISARLAGLALTQSLQLAGMLQWMVRQSAEVENNMTSGGWVLVCVLGMGGSCFFFTPRIVGPRGC
jgi:hypothetical protein